MNDEGGGWHQEWKKFHRYFLFLSGRYYCCHDPLISHAKGGILRATYEDSISGIHLYDYKMLQQELVFFAVV